MSTPILDVLIIGGGPAGLSVATALARQLYTAIVFDSGVYRNARAKHMHNVPTWDHKDPAEFRAKARKDLLARYSTIQFAEEGTKIESVRKTSRGVFQATDNRGRVWNGRKLVLASGLRDVYPDIEGYDDVWARGVYHCLFCHGYEERGAASAGVLAIGEVADPMPAVHMARMAKRLAEKVTVYTDGDEELSKALAVALADDAFTIDKRGIVKLEKGVRSGDSEVLVHLAQEDGGKVEVIKHGFITHKPKAELNGPFASQLELELTEMGVIKTTPPFYEASVKGVFAVGDCASPMPAVTNAIAMGTFAAGGLAGQLQAEPVATDVE